MATGSDNARSVIHRDFSVDDVLSQLTVDEKIALISGSDPWHTYSVPRLGIPRIRLTDGPNGVRGTKFFNGVPAACFPCGMRHSLFHTGSFAKFYQGLGSLQHGISN
jgi:beta-glucosidase